MNSLGGRPGSRGLQQLWGSGTVGSWDPKFWWVRAAPEAGAPAIATLDGPGTPTSLLHPPAHQALTCCLSGITSVFAGEAKSQIMTSPLLPFHSAPAAAALKCFLSKLPEEPWEWRPTWAPLPGCLTGHTEGHVRHTDEGTLPEQG